MSESGCDISETQNRGKAYDQEKRMGKLSRNRESYLILCEDDLQGLALINHKQLGRSGALFLGNGFHAGT